MSYYRPCPWCGAALDPGEICADCRDKRETAPDATNIESGKVKVIDQTTFASHFNEYIGGNQDVFGNSSEG